METCSKKYIDSSFGYTIGKAVKVQCQKQVYENGLCAHHYRRSIEKQTTYGQRPGYVSATQDDLNCGRILKLKNENRHYCFRLIRGKLKVNKKDVWTDTDVKPDFNLFCVKK